MQGDWRLDMVGLPNYICLYPSRIDFHDFIIVTLSSMYTKPDAELV